MNAAAKFLYVVGAYLVFSVTISPTARLDRLPFAAAIAWATAGIVVGMIGIFLHSRGKHTLRLYRDWDAERLSDLLLSEQTHKQVPPLFLYFRPFKTTGQLHLRNPESDVAGPMPVMFEGKTMELESILREGLERYGALVGLGRSGEADGAGRVESSEESWRQKAAMLADKARLILLMPSDRAGTLEEMQLVRQTGYLTKTLFLMPPQPEGGSYNAAEEWSRARASAVQAQLTLPEYRSAGCFFTCAVDGSVFALFPLDAQSKKGRMQSVLLAAAKSLGIELQQRSSRLWRSDTPPPPWLLYAAAAALVAYCRSVAGPPVPDTLFFAMHGWLLGLIFARYLPVPRLATPLIMFCAFTGSSIIGEQAAAPLIRSIPYELSYLSETIYSVVYGLPSALALTSLLWAVGSDTERSQQGKWLRITVVLAAQPLLAEVLLKLMHWVAPFDIIAVLMVASQSISAAVVGWFVFRLLLPGGVQPQTDPGPMFLVWPAGVVLIGLAETGGIAKSLSASVYFSVQGTLALTCLLLSVGLAVTCKRLFVLTPRRTAAIAAVWIAVAALGVFGSVPLPLQQTEAFQELPSFSLFPDDQDPLLEYVENARKAMLEPGAAVLNCLILALAGGACVGLTTLLALGKTHRRAASTAGALASVGFVLVTSLHVAMVASALRQTEIPFGLPGQPPELPEFPSTFVVALLWTCLASLIALIIGARPRTTADETIHADGPTPPHPTQPSQ